VTRSIRRPRRAAVLLGGAALAGALLVSGCGTGQIAETANRRPTTVGLDAQTADNRYQVRNLSLVFPGVEGYPAGGNAPLEVGLFNETKQPVTVRISTTGARSIVLLDKASATTAPVTPTESPESSPSGGEATPAPSPEPAGRPAEIHLPAYGHVLLGQTHGEWLELIGLNQGVRTGGTVNLVFDFGGNIIETNAPIALPLTPVPPATPVTGGDGGH
jgi:hypothetical protein